MRNWVIQSQFELFSKLDKDLYEDAIRMNFCCMKIEEFPDYKDMVIAEQEMEKRRIAGFN